MLLADESDKWPQMRCGYADNGYAGLLVVKITVPCDWFLDIVKRSDKAEGFEVIRRRWIVKCTFSWLDKCRRLSKDYERVRETSEAVIYVAMINLMLQRLAPKAV